MNDSPDISGPRLHPPSCRQLKAPSFQPSVPDVSLVLNPNESSLVTPIRGGTVGRHQGQPNLPSPTFRGPADVLRQFASTRHPANQPPDAQSRSVQHNRPSESVAVGGIARPSPRMSFSPLEQARSSAARVPRPLTEERVVHGDLAAPQYSVAQHGQWSSRDESSENRTDSGVASAMRTGGSSRFSASPGVHAVRSPPAVGVSSSTNHTPPAAGRQVVAAAATPARSSDGVRAIMRMLAENAHQVQRLQEQVASLQHQAQRGPRTLMVRDAHTQTDQSHPVDVVSTGVNTSGRWSQPAAVTVGTQTADLGSSRGSPQDSVGQSARRRPPSGARCTAGRRRNVPQLDRVPEHDGAACDDARCSVAAGDVVRGSQTVDQPVVCGSPSVEAVRVEPETASPVAAVQLQPAASPTAQNGAVEPWTGAAAAADWPAGRWTTPSTQENTAQLQRRRVQEWVTGRDHWEDGGETELTMRGLVVPTMDEQPPSPPPSVHVHMHEYQHSGSSSCNGEDEGVPAVDDCPDACQPSAQAAPVHKPDRTFFENVMGQVNRILNPCDGSPAGADQLRGVTDPVHRATLRQLQLAGVSVTEQQLSAEPSALDYSCLPSGARFAAPVHYSSEFSLEFNTLAMKYLDQPLPTRLPPGAESAPVRGKENSGPGRRGAGQMTQPAASHRPSDATLYGISASNMSFATRNYMEKFCLSQQGDRH